MNSTRVSAVDFALYSVFPDEQCEYKNKRKLLNTSQHHISFTSIRFQNTPDSGLAWEHIFTLFTLHILFAEWIHLLGEGNNYTHL